MQPHRNPYRRERPAAPPLSIPVPPRPMQPRATQPGPSLVTPMRRPCGFCARVRKLIGLGT